MLAIVNFVFFILGAVLQLVVYAVVINAILSWLVAFDVINLRNRFVYNVAHFLDAVTRPVLAPFQKIIPPLGGVDITPIVLILLLQALRIVFNRMAAAPLIDMLG